ncbi:hypothetical protein MM213_07885 [Belliella sp. R4-6]|uniref:6-bladed beta-propeller n=1 Tax=Belliella alkalica TaxID=1730871 RepID=A0ABS9VAD8_9BACT|nr:hypothetical protein [Belliella alkalica]MCH7413399.1 hypothetical protein [Belliella alkalica]
MKYYYLILFVFFFSCSSQVEKSRFEKEGAITITLSEKERLLSLKFSIGELDERPVLATFNSINGDVKLIDIMSGKDLFMKNIPNEGPNSISDYIMVNMYVGDQRLFIVSDQGDLVFMLDRNGEILHTIDLPSGGDDYDNFYYSDGNMLFYDSGEKIYLNVFPAMFPSRDQKKEYYSVLNYQMDDYSPHFFGPLPRENVEKFWGEGHMIVCPFGIYSNHYDGFLTGFANSNILRVSNMKGEITKKVELELPNWQRPIPTDLKYEDLEGVSQDAIYELRGYSQAQQKVWKILEMKDGFLLEVLQPISEAPLPRFSVYKFDLEFNFVSSRDFFDDHYTCYQSFIFEDKYHLVDLKAYEQNEDELVFGAFSFDDI